MPGWYELVGLGLFAFLAILPSLPVAHLLHRYVRAVLRREARPRTITVMAWAGFAIVTYAVVCVDAYLIEPNAPVVEEVELRADVDKRLRILHLSDLHIEREPARREQWLRERVGEIAPDLILLTGDVHQMDNLDIASLRRVLEPVRAPLGVFACIGFDNVSAVVRAAPWIRFLENEAALIKHEESTIGIAGLVPIQGREQAYDGVAGADVQIIMNHTPDLAEEAAAHGVDLYLCGHTHGGQVRIPVWGAIITNCQTGKRYEAGSYHLGNTLIRTSRGFGLEPRPAPQIRFCCRPEITLITIRP